MGPLTAGQIFQVCLDAGFTPDQAVTWTAIALAESGGDPAAHNPRGEDSWGLWQINVDPAVRPNHWGDLTDPAVNARAAYEVSHGGTDLRPWTVTHDANAGTAKDYRNFMDEAQAAAGGGDLGDFAGVSGYDDADPGADGPGPGPGPVEAPGPTGPAADGPDRDADGAVDAFEMAAGTDPHVPDSDADGLSDGFELAHGLDALAIDADGDGLSDRHEVRVGSDARSADSDADGVADAYELAAGRDAAHGLALGAAPHDPVDTDADGMSDAWEAAVGTDPTSGDSDDDGVADVVELVHRADALDPDSDGDGQLDGVDLLADLGADRSGAVEATWTGIDPDALPTIAAVQAEVAQLTGLTEQLAGLAPGAGAAPAVGGTTQQFLDAALAQTGDQYVFGGEAAPDDADPGVFDCSELTQWAAGQVGVDLPDGSWHQYLELEQRGALVPVEQALHTPGALLFSFSSEPTAGGGRPAEAHVAISLGNGDTIEARSTRYGVGSWDAGDRFTYAAVIPELAGAPIPVEAADDGTGADADADVAGIAAVGDVQALRAGPAGVAPLAEQIHLTARLPVAPVEPVAPAADDLIGVGAGVVAPDPTAGAGRSPVAVVARPAPVPGDGDGDGVVDAFEMSAGTDPRVADSDGDGLSDGFELGTGLDGLQLDADGDGLSDAWEVRLGTRTDTVDSDGDGRADGLEVALGRDARFGLADPGTGPGPDGVTGGLVDPVVDTDGDGLSDAWEAMLGADPTASDTDHDGLGDALELAGHTDPDDPDTDDDGVTDRWDTLDDPTS